MDALFIYLLKSSISLVILYLGYNLLFRKEAYFNFSRFWLLFSGTLIIFLPMFSYNADFLLSNAPFMAGNFSEYSQLTHFSFKEIIFHVNPISKNLTFSLSAELLILFIYFTGVFGRTLLFIFRISQIKNLINKFPAVKHAGYNFVITEKGIPSFSFLKWIFINSELFKNVKEVNTIVEHEKIHITQGHTYDLLLAELLTIVHWYNPFAFYLKKAIKENHEYITDNELLSQQNYSNSYRLMLLKYSNYLDTNILTHNFSYSLLKRRLNIMKKTKHNLGFSLRLIVLVTSLFMIFLACSSPEKKPADATKNLTEETTKTIASDSGEQLFEVVELMPEYPGGFDAMFAYISNNIKYPEAAKKDGIQGRIIVNFIIEKDGKISSVKIIKGINDDCDKEAIRVVESMPNWTPGKQKGQNVRVSFNLPIKFALQ